MKSLLVNQFIVNVVPSSNVIQVIGTNLLGVYFIYNEIFILTIHFNLLHIPILV